jgi:lipopolysaccharide assembly outer membrane protein LptD (OstA)
MDMRRIGLIAIVGAVLLLMLGFYWLGDRPVQEYGQMGPSGRDADVDVSMSGVEMRLGQEGRTLWVLKAISAAYDQDEQLVLLNTPSIIKHLSNQDLPILVDAPLGEVDQESNDIRLWSGVHMEYGPTYLNSDEAVYIQVDETVYLHGDVLLDRQGMQLRAPKADVDLTTWVVNAEGGVEVVIAKDSLRNVF